MTCKESWMQCSPTPRPCKRAWGLPDLWAAPTSAPENLPAIDPGMLRKLSGLARGGTIDKNQQALLRALTPYLSRERIGKLEKAMRAAGLARMAAGALSVPDR